MKSPRSPEAILERYGPKVDAEIEKHFPRAGEPADLYAAVWDLLDRGGKRFRPALAILSCVTVGGKEKHVITAAAAVELLHNMTLIHDDIEDESELRRGKPCIHRIYGIPTAINSGDAMLIKVFEMAGSGNVRPATKLRVLQQFAQRAFEVTWGQAYEFALWNRPNFTEHDVVRILRHKTSAMLMLAAEVGAIIGGASNREYSALSKFAENAGIGFQILDDILNVSGEEALYGKEIGGDIREGKRTIMAAKLLEAAKDSDKERFLAAMEKKSPSEFEVKEIIAMYEKYGCIEYARKSADSFASTAIAELSKLRRTKARSELETLAKFLVAREY